MKNKSLLVVALLLGIQWIAFGQDPHFSQFSAAPLNTNPALSGVFNGSYRANINYRSQWGSVIGSNAFRTVSAAIDGKFRVTDGDYYSVNFSALRDEAGLARLSLTKATAGVAFHKKIWDGAYGNTPQYLIAGAQFGFGQYALDAGNLWFTSQYNSATTSVDHGASNQEPWVTDGAPHFDFNAGLMWYSILGDNFSIYSGASLHHLNKPKVSFYEDDEVFLQRKITATIGGQVPISRELSVLPGALFMKQGPAMQTVFGGHFRYSNRDLWEMAIRAGAFARIANKLESSIHQDAIIFSATFEIERWTFGASYDMNVSSLQATTNRRGAIELSGSYTHPTKRRSKSIECPKF